MFVIFFEDWIRYEGGVELAQIALEKVSGPFANYSECVALLWQWGYRLHPVETDQVHYDQHYLGSQANIVAVG